MAWLTWKPAISAEHAPRYLLITPEIRGVDKEFKWVERKTILFFFFFFFFFPPLVFLSLSLFLSSFFFINRRGSIHSSLPRTLVSFVVLFQRMNQRGWRNTSTLRAFFSSPLPFFFLFKRNQRLLLLRTRANGDRVPLAQWPREMDWKCRTVLLPRRLVAGLHCCVRL